MASNARRPKDYKPFLIAVGDSGCFSENMAYQMPFDTLAAYGLFIKHSPYKVFPQIKNIVTQDWPDENGEDVWLPRTGIVNKAYDYDAEFIYYADDGMATENIRKFCDMIKGKWLQIYDTYTGMGRRAVYVTEFDADPPFKRRKIQLTEANGQPAIRDYVYFNVKFRVNDPSTNIVLVENLIPFIPSARKNGLYDSSGGETNLGELSLTDIDENLTGYSFVLRSNFAAYVKLIGEWYYDSAQTSGTIVNTIYLKPGQVFKLQKSILDFLCDRLPGYTGLSKLSVAIYPEDSTAAGFSFELLIYN